MYEVVIADVTDHRWMWRLSLLSWSDADSWRKWAIGEYNDTVEADTDT